MPQLQQTSVCLPDTSCPALKKILQGIPISKKHQQKTTQFEETEQ